MTKPTDIDKNATAASRRRFLREGGALLGGAVIAGGLAGSEARAGSANTANLPPNVPEWMKTPGDPMGSQPYGTPSPFEKDVIKNIAKTLPQYLSASGRTPLQDLDGIITPNGLFYERHHGGVPTIDPVQHRLMLHGLVDRPLIFTMVTSVAFLRSHTSISSNVRAIRNTKSPTARPLPTSSVW